MNEPTVSIFGIPFSRLDRAATMERLIAMVDSGKPHQVITGNPIMVMEALANPDYRASMLQADLIVPDGTGIVWAAQYIGSPVAERVPGIELMDELMAQAEERGWKVYFLGASKEVIEAAAANARKRHPRLKLVGVRDGYFGQDKDPEVIRSIREAAPDLLFVGRSADKQDPWIARYRDQLNVPLMMGVGGSFDVLSGRLKRAPKLFIRLRLEWLYRLLREPKRFKRMLVLPKFVWKVLKEKENMRNRR